jgi:Asp/Glu/hydantoin racemase
MAHVLLINPNTRAALTADLVAQTQALWRAGQSAAEGGAAADAALPPPTLLGCTAPFGADYIASESTYVVAAHAVIDAWHQHVLEHGRPRAVLVACFGDPGVWALREIAGVPVMGLAEAAMREADALGPFGIVTGGHAWGPMLERLARGLQLGGPQHLRWVRTVDASGGQLASDPEAGANALRDACMQLADDDAAYLDRMAGEGGFDGGGAAGRAAQGLQALILGGAALGGWVERLNLPPRWPVIDSVAAGARWLRGFA